MQIRKGILEDLNGMIQLREMLVLNNTNNDGDKGFLMGSERDDYYRFLVNDIVWVLIGDDNELKGFAIILVNTTIKNSRVMEKTIRVASRTHTADVLYEESCFYEQLAVVQDSRYRKYGKNLGLLTLIEAMKLHKFCITTVVKSPVYNYASRPFIKFCGFREIAVIKEDYPMLRNVFSDVFLMSRPDFIKQLYGVYHKEVLKVIDKRSLEEFVKQNG